ncbi:hypothetical protein ABPG74_019187 [Tetrahymena malaccensis]
MKIIIILFAIILVVQVNAANSSYQCQKDLMNQANNGQVCQKGDTACLTDLKSLGKCTDNCGIQNNYDQKKSNSCVDQNCTVNDPTVQKFKNEFLNCLKNSINIVYFIYLISLLFLLV